MRRTKIVCTIGPASNSPEMLDRLIRAGMNAARLNFSHGTHEEHAVVVKAVRAASQRAGCPIMILQDLCGPKIRVGLIANGPIILKPGAEFVLTSRDVPGNEHEVSLDYKDLPNDVQPGDALLLSDGALEVDVVKTDGHDILCRVIVGGPLSSHKGVNLPSRTITAPILSEKDRNDLEFGIAQGVDCVAVSFVRSVEDVRAVRQVMQEKGVEIPIIAKIEKHEALDNLDDILAAVNGIMVARGDLSVELPMEKVPRIQKMLIAKTNRAGKPVITATQMLLSMVNSPRPTRAEVADVANAVLDGTDAVMLSEESAMGKYPVETVASMAKIAEEAEVGYPYDTWLQRVHSSELLETSEAVADAAVDLAKDLRAAAIVTCTENGSTATLVAKYRPACPIIATTPVESTYHRLALTWGVVPIRVAGAKDTDQMVAQAMEAALKTGLIRHGQKVVLTAGAAVGGHGTTNLVRAIDA